MYDRESVRELLEKYKNGACDAGEEAYLHAWFNDYLANKASGLDDLEQAYLNDAVPMFKKRRVRWMYWAAAVLLIGVSAGIWQYTSRTTKRETMAAVVGAPGGNRATLTLADGRQIALRSDQSGIVTGEAGLKYNTGQKVLTTQTDPNAVNAAAELILTTPNGGTYQVTLSDGTRVWLNAGSNLRYPLRFADDERVVTLEGEAYFDVTRKERTTATGKPASMIPFVVKTRGQRLEVLGTEFNLSAYHDDASELTTLIEGKVRVALAATGADLLLLPGEQSKTDHEQITKRAVHTKQFAAWKQEEFYFDNTPLVEMMKQVARWYDIRVVYETKPPQEVFSGGMSRNVGLQTFLEFLKMSEVKYRLQGNKLTIL